MPVWNYFVNSFYSVCSTLIEGSERKMRKEIVYKKKEEQESRKR
jgi:hypothetical protein